MSKNNDERNQNHQCRDPNTLHSTSTTPSTTTTTTSCSTTSTTTSAKNNNTTTTSTSTTTTTTTQQQQSNHFIMMYSSLIAGMISGAISSTICAPIDIVRTRIQVLGDIGTTTNGTTTATTTIPTTTTSSSIFYHRIRNHIIIQQFYTIIHNEGYIGCFCGLNATLITVPTFWGCYFYCYEYWKWKLQQYDYIANRQSIMITHLQSATIAGAIADIICNPMFVVRTRLQTESLHNIFTTNNDNNNNNIHHTSDRTTTMKQQQQHKPRMTTILQTIQLLYKEGGILTFYRGMTANFIGLSHAAVQFPIYEQLKVYFRNTHVHKNNNNNNCGGGSSSSSNDSSIITTTTTNSNEELSTIELLLSSGISKMCASLLTYPHEVIRSRMMDIRSSHNIGIYDTCYRIYHVEGMIGFYSGLSLSLFRVIPNTMLTFLLYERTAHYITKQFTFYV